MIDYDQLGAFYLGREVASDGESTGQPLLYDSKDLTTHAVIVGMTGSGKTGLGIGLLEEAAIDKIPALIIDPKGDMGNLLLQFPNLSAEEFRPWVNAGEAVRRGLDVDDYAAQQAETWKHGLEEWDQSAQRIARLQSTADVTVYTPGSDAGIPLSILKSLDAPPEVIRQSADALRERISTAVSGLLTLLGLDADPLRSREHILLSNILDAAWRDGRSLDLPQLIREIPNPPFQKIGILDLESVFPAKDRMELAFTINNVLASPAFAGWTQGAPLNIQRMLYADDGRPRLAIVSIAHLSDQERMFFVSIFLNEVISWMRSQPGTSSLRALLYMDEVFGYLPPTANPPSKMPMLTLLKQARAFGLGLVLATQNPVDLDYKALSNAGTWFLGRLQTERDKARVLDGLEGASTTAGVSFDRQATEAILSGLKNRTFLLHNVHEDHPVLFQTRWALSYLRGPLTREQIQTLMKSRKPASDEVSTPAAVAADARHDQQAPVLPAEIHQVYLPVAANVRADAEVLYRPALAAAARLHYVDSKSDTDFWQSIVRLVLIEDEVPDSLWEQGEDIPSESFQGEPAVAHAVYSTLPSACARAAPYKRWRSALKTYLYRDRPLTLKRAAELDLYSRPEERDADFQGRLQIKTRESRDLQMEKLRQKHATKLARLEERIRNAQQRVEKERQQASNATFSAAVSFGTSLLGALFGRKKLSVTNLNRAATSMRAASRASDQRSDIQLAQEDVETLQSEMQQLNDDLEADLDEVKQAWSNEATQLEDYVIRPRKSDLEVAEVQLVWIPFVSTGDGFWRLACAVPLTQ